MKTNLIGKKENLIMVHSKLSNGDIEWRCSITKKDEKGGNNSEQGRKTTSIDIKCLLP